MQDRSDWDGLLDEEERVLPPLLLEQPSDKTQVDDAQKNSAEQDEEVQ